MKLPPPDFFVEVRSSNLKMGWDENEEQSFIIYDWALDTLNVTLIATSQRFIKNKKIKLSNKHANTHYTHIISPGFFTKTNFFSKKVGIVFLALQW